MAREDEQRLKDLLRNIETGDIPEDLPDPEEYDDMGGIKSLNKGAPSIKMASETPQEEFELELNSLYYEYLDAIKNGTFDGPFEDYAIKYFSTKKKQSPDMKMALGEGYKSPELNSMSMDMFGKPIKLLTPDEMDQLRQAYDDSKGRTEAMYGGRMQYKDAGSVMDVVDKKGEKEYYAAKAEQLDRKYNPQNYPPSQRNLTVEQLKKMLKKAEEDKAKRAKGGIAGVL